MKCLKFSIEIQYIITVIIVSLTMIIHVMIMTYNTWMSVKEACLKHVINTGTGSDDISIMFSLYWYQVQMIPVLCFLV